MFNNEKDINLNKLFEYYGNINVKVAKGWAARYIAEILLNLDKRHLSEAEDWTRKALEEDETNGTRWSLACDYALSAELCNRKGDPQKAKENLGKAIEIFTECGAEGWQHKAEAEMAAL